MRVAIEAQRIFRRDKHGMDFVALEFIRRLPFVAPEDEFYILVGHGDDVCLEEAHNLHIVRVKGRSYPWWEQVSLPLAVRRIKPDLLHCTSNTAPLFGRTPLVLTLHDIIFLEKQNASSPSLYQRLGRIYRRFVVPRILSRCRKVITVSEYEKQRICDTLPACREKTVAIYNGFSSIFHQLDKAAAFEVASKYCSEPGFMFFLGNTDPKKNTALTFKAYSLYLKESEVKHPLLVADISRQYAEAVAESQGCPEILDHLVISGYISHSDLPAVYNAASTFLYTSLRESFGIPILEAMACGTPVITSATSAIPEVAGDGALLVDPENPSDISEALLRLERDPSLGESAVAYGIERAKMFNWESTARGVAEVYHKVSKAIWD